MGMDFYPSGDMSTTSNVIIDLGSKYYFVIQLNI